ncbi:glutamine amidotransferase-related protein [Halothiobacillus sp. DCM-1]|uniref:glutamine amidotransferase-related protein n=1 Tax=Halothiobacillus sp. DCM-1 TaxID=3112558 RepID=UPI0032446100
MARLLQFALVLIALALGTLLGVGGLYLAQRAGAPAIPLWVLALIVGAASMAVGWRFLPGWWRPVLFFLPLAAVLSLSVNPWLLLMVALVLLALQWNAIFTRIPLYRADAVVADTLLADLRQSGARRLLDIGCGDGRLLWRLARAMPDGQFVGIESAPILWLIARWRCRRLKNCVIRFGDFWAADWAGFDRVFAFLSPEPMLRVWRKAGRELPPGGRLLSLAFPVPGVTEDALLPAGQFDVLVYHRWREAPANTTVTEEGTPMNVVVFQHEAFEGLGALAPWLRARQAVITTVEQFEPQPVTPPPVATVDLLIVLGGPMSVHDTAQLPWLVTEKAYIREALAAGVPTLGICLGAQLMAEQAGAVVQKNPQPEIGWWPVQWRPEAQAIWPDEPAQTRVFHWHGETFGLPPGAALLGQSDACAHQGFVLPGGRAVGLQFHLEMTAETVDCLIEHSLDELVDAPFVASAETMRTEPAESYARNQQMMAQLLRFLTRIE